MGAESIATGPSAGDGGAVSKHPVAQPISAGGRSGRPSPELDSRVLACARLGRGRWAAGHRGVDQSVTEFARGRLIPDLRFARWRAHTRGSEPVVREVHVVWLRDFLAREEALPAGMHGSRLHTPWPCRGRNRELVDGGFERANLSRGKRARASSPAPRSPIHYCGDDSIGITRPRLDLRRFRRR